MKNFFKKNWWIILGIVLGFILTLLGAFTIVCLLIGVFIIGTMLLIISVRLKKRYDALLEKAEQDDSVFDATKYDYDEDVYIIGTKPRLKTQIKQGLFSKLSALGPSILFGMFGVGLIVLAITIVIKIII